MRLLGSFGEVPLHCHGRGRWRGVIAEADAARTQLVHQPLWVGDRQGGPAAAVLLRARKWVRLTQPVAPAAVWAGDLEGHEWELSPAGGLGQRVEGGGRCARRSEGGGGGAVWRLEQRGGGAAGSRWPEQAQGGRWRHRPGGNYATARLAIAARRGPPLDPGALRGVGDCQKTEESRTIGVCLGTSESLTPCGGHA